MGEWKMDKEKLNSFLSKIYDDSENNVELNNAINVISDIMGDVSDEELMAEIKKYGIDKLKGFDTEVLGKEANDELSDVNTDISDKEYDEYVKLRNPTEASKNQYGQRVADDSFKRSKEDIEQRKKDVEEHSNFVRHNPFQDMYKNENITDELNEYDVKAMLKKYTDGGMTKEDALIQVRKDIDNIRNRRSTFGEDLQGKARGLLNYIAVPKMAEDYYVQKGITGSTTMNPFKKEFWTDDPELRIRAGLGDGLNVLEIMPTTKGIGKAGKALVYGAKPIVEAVRTNVYDTDDADVGGAIKDAAINTGLNVLFDVPQILPEFLKQQAGLGGILEKAKPVQSLLEGIQEAEKVGAKKPLAKDRQEKAKIYKDYFDIDIGKIKHTKFDTDDLIRELAVKDKGMDKDQVANMSTGEILKYLDENNKHISKYALKNLRSNKKANMLKEAFNERIPDVENEGEFKEFTTRTAEGLTKLKEKGENLDGFDNNYLLGKKLENPIDADMLYSSWDADTRLYNNASKYSKGKKVPNVTDEDIDELAKIRTDTYLKHKKIAKATKSGIPSGLARGLKSDTSAKESDNKAKAYADYLKNDELALRMWKAGFTPHDLTKEQKEKINDLLRE